MFNKSGNKEQFKTVIRDFLIATTEISANDPGLYSEELEKEREE
jgi:hypothetical protein